MKTQYSVLNYIYLYSLLAQSFLRAQGLFMNISISILARRFAYPARPKASDKRSRTIVLRALSTGHRTQPGCKYTAKMKTKPFQSQTKPFFQRSIFDSGPKTGILDKFRQTFLCKTKPFFSIIQIENKGLTAVSKSSARLFKN